MNADVERMQNEAKCEWPDCKCIVPSFALSAQNRVSYCNKLKDYDKEKASQALR